MSLWYLSTVPCLSGRDYIKEMGHSVYNVNQQTDMSIWSAIYSVSFLDMQQYGAGGESYKTTDEQINYSAIANPSEDTKIWYTKTHFENFELNCMSRN